MVQSPITYSLQSEDGNSDIFYNKLNLLTDAVLTEANELYNIVDNYIWFLTVNEVEKIRSRDEYLFELLSLGVYQREYFSLAFNSSEFMMKLLAKLYYLRRRNKTIKPYVDYCRGILMTMFLVDERDEPYFDIETEMFKKVVLWLESSGEFREEVKRFNNWLLYIDELDEFKMNQLYKALVQGTHFFEVQSEYYLGEYSANLDDYLISKHQSRKFKEDYIFCGRRKSEYYLAMLGSEIMNRAFKEDFNKTNKKAVLVPACMRIKSEPECKAQRVSLDYTCSLCDKKCNVYNIAKLGEKYNFETHIIPHSSDFTNWLKTWAVGNDIGVVGVACPLNLTTGGLELKDLDISAQCVLLDYCGCTNHWDEKGIPTELNEKQLLKLLDVN